MRLPNSERYPLQNERGEKTLKFLTEHPHAPRFNYECGDQLSAESLQIVRDYEAQLRQKERENSYYKRGEIPDWLREFAEFCAREVPFYRRNANRSTEQNSAALASISSTRNAEMPHENAQNPTRRNAELRDEVTPSASAQNAEFFNLPTCSRADYAREPWAFVPDSQPLDDLVMYCTSGTQTGAQLPILSHPRTTTLYLPLLKLAASRHEIAWKNSDDASACVALALICAQKKTLTFASVSSYLGGAGFVKINLHRDDWRNENDRERFLESCAPLFLSGDPLSFRELMKLKSSTRNRPRALFSSATALLPALKNQLETHFGCPVLDIYSTTESGPISVATDAGHELLPHDLYVEILREDGSACDENERGEIVLSGGRNPFWPLLRYRTGDFARLKFRENGAPLLLDFAGRAPVMFRNSRGDVFTSIDVANALRPFALSHFSVLQRADQSVILRVPAGNASDANLRDAIEKLFADEVQIEEILDFSGEKTSYQSELSLA